MTETDASAIPEEDPLVRFSDECSWLLTAYEGDETLESALAGLYYAMKSTRIAPRVVDTLLLGDSSETTSSGRGEDACYVAETMVKTVHSSGDLLAQAVNVCVCEPRLGVAGVTLFGVKGQVERQSQAGIDAQLRDWYARVAVELGRLADSPDYLYVSDFTNTSKHQAFINRTIVTTDDSCAIVFNAFTRNDRSSTREHAARSFSDVCAMVGRIRDSCIGVVQMMEQRQMWDRTVASGGSLVSDFLSVNATPQVMTAEDFTTRTYKSFTDDAAGHPTETES